MDESKRKFFKYLSVDTCTPLMGTTHAADMDETATNNDKICWRKVVDLRKCIRCKACTLACSMKNAVPQGKFRTIVSNYEIQSQDKTRNVVLARLCKLCEKPPCIQVCPVLTTYQPGHRTWLWSYRTKWGAMSPTAKVEIVAKRHSLLRHPVINRLLSGIAGSGCM